MTDTQPGLLGNGRTGQWINSHYGPVHVTEAVGTFFLGILALILLVALLRAQARNRALLARCVSQEEGQNE